MFRGGRFSHGTVLYLASVGAVGGSDFPFLSWLWLWDSPDVPHV